MSSLSASVFRRGGPKKELMELGAPTADGLTIEQADQEQLNAELEQLLEVLKTPKTGKDWSAALWRPEVGAAELVLMRRATGINAGFKWRKRHWLHMEEAAFLVDRSDLLLFIEEPSAQTTADNGTISDLKQQQQQQPTTRRLLSLQETFELMVLSGVSMERYMVYSHLSKSGYLIMRFPSCWVVPDRLTPGDVWGHGAWQGCAGMHVPTGPVRGAAGATHIRSMHQGVAPSERIALEGEEDEAQGLQSADTDAGGRQQQAVASEGVGTGTGAGNSKSPASKRIRLETAGDGDAGDVTLAHGDAAVSNEGMQIEPAEQQLSTGRTWWPRMSQLPMLATQGASAESCHTTLAADDAFKHAVDLPVADLLRQSCPRLQPCPSIAPDAQLAGAPVSTEAHLVFDVYKPGAHVARSKRVFPLVACHLALCSSRPPRLQELHAADREALTTTVPVKWVAVEGGICTWYEMSGADLLRLM